jgi:apolipoprotein N-acyltransferase
MLGAASVLGYAPFQLFPIPVLTLAAAALIWHASPRPREAALHGFAFGLGLFGAGVSWVYVSLHDFGGMPALIAGLTTLVFCAYLALYPALIAWVLRWLALPAAVGLSLLLPALWTLAEWLRGWLFTGFPWLALGYSQVPNSPLAGFAPLLGVYGVSLLTAFLSGGVALIGRHIYQLRQVKATKPLRSIASLKVLWVVVALPVAGLLLHNKSWTEPVGEPVSVAIVQGNVPQDLKWRPERAQRTLDLYSDLTLGTQARLVLLPETALPMFQIDLPAGYLDRFAAHARAQGGDLLTGIPEYAGPGRYYNSVISVGASPSQLYRKVHLVPFGDYFPLTAWLGWFMNLLDIPMSDFSRGTPDQAPLEVAGQKVAANICYEDAFGEEIIRQLPEATLLANFTNDAWWGRSLGSKQHLQIAQMRSLETGRYMLRATNTGMTAIIDPRGMVADSLPEFQVAVLEGKVTGHRGATPYVAWGNGAALLIASALLALGLLGLRRVRAPAKKIQS